MEHEERQILRKMGPQEVAAVYEGHMRKDFPASELKPLSSIRRMQAEGIYDCLGFYEGDVLVAYAFFVADRGRGYLLLDYLAVCGPYRGGGYGSRCLEKIKGFYKEENGILLECESRKSAKGEAELTERERRIRFYLRNGCVETGVMSLLFGVEFEILYLAKKNDTSPTAEGFRKTDGAGQSNVAGELERLYRKMLPENIYEKQVRIW